MGWFILNFSILIRQDIHLKTVINIALTSMAHRFISRQQCLFMEQFGEQVTRPTLALGALGYSSP
jgi:hypothetical protein